MNSYDLSRNFWNWAFDNPEKISPNHAAVYFFAIEHCNRLGWKEKFGFPSQMTMDAIGIKKHSTYIRYFKDLIEFGFFELIQESKNQYSSNIIRLTSALPKKGEAIDKAMLTHRDKHTANQKEYKQTTKQLNKEQLNNIDNIYSMYPAKCVKRKVSTGKSSKDKDRIKTILSKRSYDDVVQTITQYLNEAQSSNSYIKNFSTFLNNFPDKVEDTPTGKVEKMYWVEWWKKPRFKCNHTDMMKYKKDYEKAEVGLKIEEA